MQEEHSTMLARQDREVYKFYAVWQNVIGTSDRGTFNSPVA